jgi:hypothetical protein
MLEAMRTAWRKWRVNRRQYQIDRAMYKAGGGRDPRHGGMDGGKRSDSDINQIGSGGGGAAP